MRCTTLVVLPGLSVAIQAELLFLKPVKPLAGFTIKKMS